MSRQNLIAGAIAVVIVVAAVASILYSTKDNKVQLTGELLRVRTHVVDPENTVLVADIRVANPSTQQFVVQDVEVFVDDLKGDVFSESDAQQLFNYYPVLGKKYNPNLMVRQKINSGQSIDRMVTVRLGAKDEKIQQRKALRIVITDVDGAKTEILETKKS
ncbi:MAG TPA: hypothetical protein VER03_04520 [Bryobacteraceae bacterium]|nr:hypothetical protein [Bryobacteraceae bacterium]